MLKYFLIVFCVACCEGQLSSLLDDPADTRIVGGHSILSTKDAKYLVSLKIEWFFGVIVVQCAGTIIDEYHILTACHCVIGMTKAYARIGSIYPDHGGYVYTATLSACHHGYNVANNDNDIAIIKVDSKMTFDGIYTGPVSLPPVGCTRPVAGDVIFVCGWGVNDTSNPVPTSVVNCIELPVIDHKTCQEQYKAINRNITENMFCAGNLTADGQDSCQGDSGSGTVEHVTTDPKPSNRTQNGIVSWGNGCANKNFAGVYTVVCNYVCWISLMLKLPLSGLEIILCNKQVPTIIALPGLT